MRHLEADQLLDIVDGLADDLSREHLHTCDRCQAAAAQVRATWSAVADVEMPEPSPLFWDHFSTRVQQAVAAEPARVASVWKARLSAWTLAGAAGVAVVALAVTVAWREHEPRTLPATTVSTSAPVVTPSPEALIDDDASLELLADLAGDLDWEGAAEAGLLVPAGGIDRAMVELSALEREELHRILTAEMNGRVL